ncbi:MAG TPA: transglutaminase domain-containing protein [Flavisolibacter sp.]|jgi:hypothetical protein|nr:transglutaminase domain-containing protein [Flavisolibacter sp.]
MKNAICTLLAIVFYLQSTTAQVISGTSEASPIPEQNTKSVALFTAYLNKELATDSARIKAIYNWITNNVRYDIQRLQAIKDNANPVPQGVADVLKTRSAVCQGYADLFVALCEGVGIRATVISGYTKLGGLVSSIGHAWTAAMLGGNWYLFDPTWGAGYVHDNKFTKAYNSKFFMMPAEEMIRDHMPFDPVYQFLPYPLNNREFISGAAAGNRTQVFSFKDSLVAYESLSQPEKWKAELRRLSSSGIQNDLLAERERYLKNALQSTTSKNKVDEGGEAYTKSMDLYKDYIGYKNKQFKTVEVKELERMLDEILSNMRTARALLLQAVPKTAEQREAVAANTKNIDGFRQMVVKEQEFVKEYINTDPARRPFLFMQRTNTR